MHNNVKANKFKNGKQAQKKNLEENIPVRIKKRIVDNCAFTHKVIMLYSSSEISSTTFSLHLYQWNILLFKW